MKKIYTIAIALLITLTAGAQTIIYSNDFESGLNGSTIVGNGVIEASGNPAYGQVFHNDPTLTKAIRTNYLLLPSTVFSDLQTSAANALTISFWVNKSNAIDFNYTALFSAYGSAPNPANTWPMMVLQTRLLGQVNNAGWSDLANAQNVNSVNKESSAWINNTSWHFYTATFTPTSVKVYVDGVIQNEWVLDGVTAGQVVSGLFTNGNALPYICLGGNQAWGWNDPDPAFMFDKLKIYAGALTTAQINSLMLTDELVAPVLTSSKSSFYFDNLYTSESMTVIGANLTQNITITTPVGITADPNSIPLSPAIEQAVHVLWDGTTSINGNITITSGSKTVIIPVKSSTNVGCFTPAYSGNMIADPTFSAASLAAGGFTGWGPTGITYTNAYCGRGSAFVRGTCWPDGGSIDRPLTSANGNALIPNNNYLIRAMIKSQASPGTTFQFEVEGVNGTASTFFPISNTNGWQQLEFTFTTGATVTTGKGIYFNSCNATSPALADTCFIDNWEMYNLSAIISGTQNINLSTVNNFVRNNKILSEFNTDASALVSINLYNVNGMLIESKTEICQPGKNEKILNANLKSGVYLVKTSIDGKITMNKIVF